MNFKETFKGIRASLLGFDPGFLRVYYKLFYQPKPNTLANQINQLAKEKDIFCFFQVGGNDGFANDPIFKFVKRYGWKGIIVEPQKDVFKNRLKKTYRFDKNVILENIAIASETAVRKLYKPAMSNSRWATGLATFNRAVLEKQIESGHIRNKAEKEGCALPKNTADWITHEDVHCTSIEDLMGKHQIKTLDLLQIDTEGFDYEIIKTINFKNLKPAMITYEHEHLSEIDAENCAKLLTANGYSLKQFEGDSIAILKQ